MKFKLEELKAVLRQLSYSSHGGDNAEIEIVMKNEDIQGGKLCDYMVFTLTHAEAAGSYDDNDNPYSTRTEIEVFPINENLPPRVTQSKTRELKFKSY